MNKIFSRNIIRFLLVFALQILILKRIEINIGNFQYLHLLVYPIIILLLPIRSFQVVSLIVAFFVGLSFDMFYDSPGVHAGALVFMTFVRPLILKMIEPTEGYTSESTPTIFKMGFTWFFIYGSILLFIHHLVYFSLDAFSYVYLLEILLRTIFSFFASLILILILMIITNPKY